MKQSIALACLLICLAGCGRGAHAAPEMPGALTEVTGQPSDTVVTEEGMRADFVRFVSENFGFTPSLDEVRVEHLVGIYSGCPVVFMGAPLAYTEALRPVEVAGYIIIFGDGQRLYVYHDSTFYTLEEAYAADLLTAEDVRDIGMKVGSEFERYNTRHPLDDPSVDTHLAYDLREDFAAWVRMPFEDVYVERLIDGYYSDCLLVCMGGAAWTQGALSVTVGEYTIQSPCAVPILVWDCEKFYLLGEAYDAGLLNEQDIHALANCLSWQGEPNYETVIDTYYAASTAASWFEQGSMPYSYDDRILVDGIAYYPTSSFSTLAELRAHLELLFSTELVERYLSTTSPHYREIGGVLHVSESVRGTNIRMGDERYLILNGEGEQLTLRVVVEQWGSDAQNDWVVTGYTEYDYPMARIEGRWVFTDFPYFR